MPHVYIGPDMTEEEETRVFCTMLEELLMAQLRKALDKPEFAARVIKIAEEMDDVRLAGALRGLTRPAQGELRVCACGCGNWFVATSENQLYCDLGCGDTREIQADDSQTISAGGRSTALAH
jgi:predicted RNA-binding Zn ribbon-like protein